MEVYRNGASVSTQLETRRDYLVRLGLAKPGRGKFSNAGKEALAKADEEGVEFLDGPAPKGNGSGPILSTVPPKREQAEDVRLSDYLFPSDFRFPEQEYIAVSHIGGKRNVYGMRECCNTCRVSLTNHSCNTPTVHGNIPVTIERR